MVEVKQMKAPKVLLVNPNSNTATTAMMCRYAQAALPECEVLGVTAAQGPKMIIDAQALAASIVHTVAAVLEEIARQPDIEAVLVAAFGDPGRDELAAALDIPVFGIGKSAITAASSQGRTFGIATSTPGLVQQIVNLANRFRGESSFVGVSLTESDPLTLAADPDRQFAELRDAVQVCVGRGAEIVVIGGGPLSEAAKRLVGLGIAEIVEPVPAGCAQIRQVLFGAAHG